MALTREATENSFAVTLEASLPFSTADRLTLLWLGKTLQDTQSNQDAALVEALLTAGALERKGLQVRQGGDDNTIEIEVAGGSFLRVKGLIGQDAAENVSNRQEHALRYITNVSQVASVLEVFLIQEGDSVQAASRVAAQRKGIAVIAMPEAVTVLPLIQRSRYERFEGFEYGVPPVSQNVLDMSGHVSNMARSVGYTNKALQRMATIA